MKCQDCLQAGEKSTVYPGMTTCTAMWSQPFYDEDGKYHHHDANSSTTSYSCSRGHRWSESSRASCWCGWPENKNAPSGALVISNTTQ